MSVRDVIRTVLRGEVDQLDRGTDHLTTLRERRAERQAQRDHLRQLAQQTHPDLRDAIKRRQKVM